MVTVHLKSQELAFDELQYGWSELEGTFYQFPSLAKAMTWCAASVQIHKRVVLLTWEYNSNGIVFYPPSSYDPKYAPNNF